MKHILVTGANGEMGHGLIKDLSSDKSNKIVALDIADLDSDLSALVHESIKGDIIDPTLVKDVFAKYEFDTIFHLASMLSTSSERDPVRAHHTNTDGALNVLFHSDLFCQQSKKGLVFVFPSSIAVYGMPTKTKETSAGVKEGEFNNPATMYGCNKLYVEKLGTYYSKYRNTGAKATTGIDYRVIRFPGIISAETTPTGGTSDYGPEMLHAAAQKKDYECFVRSDTTIPFMAMPDAIKAITVVAAADSKSLSQSVYNVSSFSVSAAEIEAWAKELINPIDITYKPDVKRQAIVDSWPKYVDDSAARADWGWEPDLDEERTFKEYLAPKILEKYT